jgi:hypothetical protein
MPLGQGYGTGTTYPDAGDLSNFIDAAGFRLRTTVATAANSGTQALASTANVFPGDLLYFAKAGVLTTVNGVTGNSVVLAATVNSTAGEQVRIYGPGTDLAGNVLRAAQDFERDAGRKMIAVSDTRTFDPPSNRYGRLFTGDMTAVTTITFATQTLVVTTDYLAQPAQNPARGLPYFWIDFFRRWGGPTPWAQREGLSITGLFGYAAQIPYDVWQAVLAKATVQMLPALMMQRSRGFKAWSEADVHQDYGEKAPALLWGGQWDLLYQTAVARYKNAGLGAGGWY